jgi:nucleoside-diphosphate-sugar epimerase
MKLLITGSTGFIGKRLVDLALVSGYKVLAVHRSAAPEHWAAAGVETLTCDLSVDPLPDLKPYAIDCVIHLAAEMQPGRHIAGDDLLIATQKLLQASQQAGIPKFIGMSSLSVLDYVALKPLATIDESVSVANQLAKMGRYAAFKAKQEALFQTYPANWIILRPGLVYNQQTLSPAHAGIIKGKYELLIAHPGEVPLVDLDSVVSALLAACQHNDINNEIINLVDDGLPSQAEYQHFLLAKSLLKSGGKPVSWQLVERFITLLLYPLVKLLKVQSYLPEVLLPHAFASRLKPFKFSNLKAKQLLNWTAHRFNQNL